MPVADPPPRLTTEIAELFPPQGHWSDEEYLAIETNRLIELVDGTLDILPMPTTLHQWLADVLDALLVEASGRRHVVSAPYKLRLRTGLYREPDVLYSETPFDPAASATDSADLVIEIVSEGAEQRERDYVAKRRDYAAAGVREYWIVDPWESSVTVLVLDGEAYAARDDARTEGMLRSDLLPGFAVELPELFTQFE